MDILNGDWFYGHYIFYRLLPIDLHELHHYYHFKVLDALSPSTIFTMYRCMKCVECITALFLCIDYYTCFVRNDEIKMYNQITVLCAKFQSDSTTAQTVMQKREFCAIEV